MEPTKVKSMSFGDVMDEVVEKAHKAQKEFEDNGGICLHCGKHPGDPNSVIDQFNCKACNEETEALLSQLRGPGFGEFKVAIPKKS